MQFTESRVQARVPVTVLCLEGDLDAATYQGLITKAQRLYETGTRDLLLDLTDVGFISSAGIVALHSIALLMREDGVAGAEDDRESLRNVSREESGLQKHVKLLNPQPKVDRALEMVGFKDFFEIYRDQAAAIASF